jgi:glycosyltransferase involved in cell wall biosynthesis
MINLKILFFFPNQNRIRNKSLSYTNLKEGSGFSGTETALLEMSKFLVDRGHSVQIYGVAHTYTDHGIHFISENEIDRVDLDIDWYSPIFFCFADRQKDLLNRLNPQRTKVFIWFQCFILDNYIHEIKQRFRVYAQYVSNYVANEYPHIIDINNSWTIYNGVDENFTNLQIPDTSVKRGNWIFHAVYERGGSIAKQIFSKINIINEKVANKMQLLSYHTPDLSKYPSSKNIINCGSKPKIEVRDILLKSDYFVYPLVLDDGCVHHDTFASVILEALASGTIVVVWDVACISSVYEDYVVKIPVPERIKRHYNPSARFASCHWMTSDEAQQLYINKIMELESDQVKKELIRARGAEWARKITWATMGSQMERHLISNI